MSRLFHYMRRYRRRYAIGGACLLATASLAMAVPYLLKQAVDSLELEGSAAVLTRYAMAIIVIAIVQGVVRTLSRALIFNVGRDVERDIRNDLFAHLLRLPAAYYQSQQTGDLMSRLVNDVNAIRLVLGVGILNLVNTPLYYAYGIGIMLSLDPALTVVALLPFPLLLLAVKRVSRRLMDQTLLVQSGLAGLSASVQESVSGIHVIKSYVAEETNASRFAQLNAEFTAHSVDLARVRGRIIPTMRIAAGSGVLIVLSFGGLQVIHGRLGLGDLVAFIGYLNLLAWPTMAMGWMISLVQRGRAAMKRLEEIFAIEPAIQDAPGATPLERVDGLLELDHVDFAYRAAGNGHQVVQDVSIRVEPGQHLAIVGRTGAGKTSLAQLVPRMFDPSAGAIRLDRRDIRTLPLSQLRGAIGYVPQDPFLFSTTIARNIAFARDDDDLEAVRDAAERAGVATDIASFPKGYDTMVGERGVTLSGGQKQRLTLARALAADPRILILDDALASVDTRTEREILERLQSFMKDRTVIWIAHRISTIRHADHIVVIDRGRVLESGTHDRLLAHQGVYAELFRQQQLEEELEEL